jgi:hypothetical protein
LPSRNTHLGRYRRTAHVLSRHGLGYVVGVFFAGTSSTVDLPLRALTALKRHRKRQLEEKLGAGGSYEDSGLVFATAKGTPLDAQNVVNRHFKPLLRRAPWTRFSTRPTAKVRRTTRRVPSKGKPGRTDVACVGYRSSTSLDT